MIFSDYAVLVEQYYFLLKELLARKITNYKHVFKKPDEQNHNQFD